MKWAVNRLLFWSSKTITLSNVFVKMAKLLAKMANVYTIKVKAQLKWPILAFLKRCLCGSFGHMSAAELKQFDNLFLSSKSIISCNVFECPF